MNAILAGLGSVLLSMGMKMLGYTFISKALVISLKAWAKTTESESDDEIVAAIAEALEIDPEKLK